VAYKKRLCAYLSGGMEHAKNDGAGWRTEMESFLRDELGHRAFNPATASQIFLESLGVKDTFRAMKATDPDRYFSIVRRIVDGDSKEVTKRCDYVICLWDRSAARGAGTQGELTLARLSRKPVYLVSRIPFERIPGWVIGCATKRFKSFSALREFLQSHVSSHGG
jgi:hypothetical protein